MTYQDRTEGEEAAKERRQREDREEKRG